MIEMISGCSSGLIQSIIGHPIDTAKILIQANKPFHKNILHYYRGISYPTTFNIASTGLTFNIHSYYSKTTGSHYYGGFMTGLSIAPIVHYFDIGKIYYQTNPQKLISLSNFKIINGMYTTIARESIATSFYMGIYFNMEERYGALFSGATAGLISWLVTYPLDVIKTRQMCNEHLSFSDALKIGNLWKGFSFCAIRAILCNSAGFWIYHNTKLLLISIDT